MKKVFVTGHNLGRLANQLWQYISVYAFCLEHNYQCINLAFFEYETAYDKLPKSYLSYVLNKIHIISLGFSKKYGRYIGYIFLYFFSYLIKLFYRKNALFISDWLYRNPKGIEKYRDKIIKTFRPSSPIWNRIVPEINTLRKKYKTVIGVHIRKGDYRTPAWKDKYFNDHDVGRILHEYLKTFILDSTNTCFLLCSDGPIDISEFKDLSVSISKGSAVEDLYKLSLTDMIIGSDSTFGAFASYYGNIPYMVFHRSIDWNYYRKKTKYFENKYNTTVHYRPAK